MVVIASRFLEFIEFLQLGVRTIGLGCGVPCTVAAPHSLPWPFSSYLAGSLALLLPASLDFSSFDLSIATCIKSSYLTCPQQAPGV